MSQGRTETIAKQSRPRPRLSKRRRRQFIVASLLFPFVVLALLEFGLRLAGFGGYPTTFRRIGNMPDGSSLVVTDNPGPASYFFANRSRPGTLHQGSLVMPKPPGVFRVVLAGESAMKGFPQPRALSSASFLREMLGDAWPDRKIEVINLGTTAVASFPVLGMLTESLDYAPDLCVVYVGNNEFFGAYGVASLHSAGRTPTGIRVVRAFRWLAIAQAIDSVLGGGDATADKTLMEAMIGRASIAPDDPLRTHAAANLGRFTGEMIDRCKARGVPILVCTLPANERDLAPLGTTDRAMLAESDRGRLEQAVKQAPGNAAAWYGLGRAFSAAGDHAAAAESYRKAIDLDPMPWRPPGASVDAIRRAAAEHGGTLCDLQRAFREASPGGSIGWDLMDDHVHPTLRGQDLVARTIVSAMTGLSGLGAVSSDQIARLRTFDEYAAKLGANPYEEYGVAHQMRVLGRIPFIEQTTPELLARSEATCGRIAAAAMPEVREAMSEWQKPRTHKGEQRPISGMVARILVQKQNFAAAEPLYRVAADSVTPYSSWNIEFTYFMLACRERARGGLNDADREIAMTAIRRGEFLLGQGRSETGQTERFVGRLYQLRREFDKAIPFLLTAREKLSGTDLVGNDQALVESYLRTGQRDKAGAVIQNGIDRSGQYAEFYRRMRPMLDAPAPSGGAGAGK
ncbi:MAG: tetratricopeptide repeat protein [Phycisphaerales bacterium]|nr:tetratricopeptide repeat protein [Phycisphaerales bacterium]